MWTIINFKLIFWNDILEYISENFWSVFRFSLMDKLATHMMHIKYILIFINSVINTYKTIT